MKLKLMKKIFLLLTTVLCFTALNAQNWTGFYKLNVDKDGYRATLKVQIYSLNGEIWGTLRGQDNEASTERWEIEFWTMEFEDQNTIACYYDKGNDVKFPENNALLFSLTGNKNDFTTSFGDALINVIKHLETHQGFSPDNTAEAEVEEFTSTIYIAPDTETPEQPEVIINMPAVNNSTSKSMLIVGSWKGDDATSMTKYFDYYFDVDGTGNRGNLDFTWTYVNEFGTDYIEIQYYTPITRATYQQYLSKIGDTMEIRDGMNIINTTDGERHAVKIIGSRYLELSEKHRLKIDSITESSLELSYKLEGKTVKTTHYKG